MGFCWVGNLIPVPVPIPVTKPIQTHGYTHTHDIHYSPDYNCSFNTSFLPCISQQPAYKFEGTPAHIVAMNEWHQQ